MRIQYPKQWSQASCEALDELFKRARKEHLWFFLGGLTGPIWFSPDELEAQQKEGKFIWGADNWRLRNPQERVQELTREIEALDRQRDALCIRIKGT